MAAWTGSSAVVRPTAWQQAASWRQDYGNMSLTKKDLEDVSKLTAKVKAVVDVLVPVLRPLLLLGIVRRFIARTASGRVGAISRYTKRGEHDKAADLAIELLKENRHRPAGSWRPSGRDYWWLYMYFAARSLDNSDDQVKREEVIEMARNGVEPFQGYYVARSFLAFSRWKYRDGDYDGAIEFAETAASADDTWAEPDFVLGWYHLVLGGGDPMRHLTRAIRKDHRILFRIVNDSECRKHPHIVQRLKDLSADGIVTVRDKPDADDRGGSVD